MSSPQAVRTACATGSEIYKTQLMIKFRLVHCVLQAFDEYGFPLDLTPQQAKARQECIAAQRKQEEKWLKHAKAGQLPPMEKLKKLCRKVRQRSAKGCGLEVDWQTYHSQGGCLHKDSTAGRWGQTSA